MADFFDAATSPVNLPYTLLLGIAAAFWIAVLLGILDAKLLDWTEDEELSPEDRTDDAGAAGQSGLATAIADFLHLDQAPMSVFVTLALIVAWLISLLTNSLLHNDEYRITLALAIPNFVVSILVARMLLAGLGRLRGHRRELPLVGRLCEVVSNEVNQQAGECTLSGTNARLSLAARTRDGEVLARGETAVIVEWLRADNLFIVTRHRGIS